MIISAILCASDIPYFVPIITVDPYRPIICRWYKLSWPIMPCSGS